MSNISVVLKFSSPFIRISSIDRTIKLGDLNSQSVFGTSKLSKIHVMNLLIKPNLWLFLKKAHWFCSTTHPKRYTIFVKI